MHLTPWGPSQGTPAPPLISLGGVEMGPDWYVGILAVQTGDGEPWSLVGTGPPAPKAAERFEVQRAAVRNGAGAGERAWLLQGTLHTRVSGDRKRYVSICVPGKPKAAGPCAISAHCKECVAIPRGPPSAWGGGGSDPRVPSWRLLWPL